MIDKLALISLILLILTGALLILNSDFSEETIHQHVREIAGQCGATKP